VVGDDPLDDAPDRVPPDPQHAGDRGLGHLLRQPGDDVFEVARVVGVRARPRHCFQMHPAHAATQPPELALDHTPAGAEIEVPPTLDPPVVDLQMAAGLAALPAHPAPAPEPDGHDHPLDAEADVDDRCAGQAQQPIECSGDAHVALLAGRLTFEQPAACDTRAAARRRALRNLRRNPQQRKPCSTPEQSDFFTPNPTGDPINRG
jgi:hypothetical protein